MLRALLFVGLGGAIGSIARYLASVATSRFITHSYPFATFLVNIVGCFTIGLLFGYAQKNSMLHSNWWLILATGFCGGFTTFSTFALENINLLRAGDFVTAVMYTALSVIIGLLLCRAGIWLVAHQ